MRMTPKRGGGWRARLRLDQQPPFEAICVPKMAFHHFPSCKFHLFPLQNLGPEERGSGGSLLRRLSAILIHPCHMVCAASSGVRAGGHGHTRRQRCVDGGHAVVAGAQGRVPAAAVRSEGLRGGEARVGGAQLGAEGRGDAGGGHVGHGARQVDAYGGGPAAMDGTACAGAVA